LLRILWWGDGGCTTGFGRVTHEICNRLGELYDVHVLGLNFRGELDPPFDTAKYKIHNPTRWEERDTYGFNRLPELIKRLKPDLVVMLNDLPIIAEGYAFLDQDGCELPPVVVYTPIDAANLPPEWGVIANRPEVLITYTQFAKRELAKVTDRDIRIAYHGIDHGGFEQISREHPAKVTTEFGDEVECYSKAELKEAFGLQDNFVILWADRNSQRKYTPGAFQAVKPFMERHPEAILWMHCAEKDQGGDLTTFTQKYRLDGRVYKTPDLDTFYGVSDAYMNVLYNMADVKISTSQGEGAGLTNMEAARVGTPVILQDFSANFEMLGDDQWYVSSKFIYTSPRGCDFAFPDVDEYDHNLEMLYHQRGREDDTGGMDYVKQFTWDKAVEEFRAAFVEALTAKWEKTNVS
jgi:glycosyltransferase involved in cell wall biosynthesis